MPKKTKPSGVKRCNFDVDGELLGQFQEACRERLTNPSLVFRHFMKTYVDELERDKAIRKQESGANRTKKRK